MRMPDANCPYCGNKRHGREAGWYDDESWLKCHYCWIMWVEGVFYYYNEAEPTISRRNWVLVPDGCLIVKREEAGLRWDGRGRCRCDVCERLRAAGAAGLDGISPREQA